MLKIGMVIMIHHTTMIWSAECWKTKVQKAQNEKQDIQLKERNVLKEAKQKSKD